MSEGELTRINKYLSEIGFCSRRAADKLIEEGRVKINGVIPEMGTKVGKDDQIHVDGKLIQDKKAAPVYLAFNKPRGIVCTTDTKREKDNIVDFINYPERIFPVGRLDKASEGLIFMTNDGDIVNKILRARKRIHCSGRSTHYITIPGKDAFRCTYSGYGNTRMYCRATGPVQIQNHIDTGIKQTNPPDVRVPWL